MYWYYVEIFFDDDNGRDELWCDAKILGRCFDFVLFKILFCVDLDVELGLGLITMSLLIIVLLDV